MAATVGGGVEQSDGNNSSTTITISGFTPPSGDNKILVVDISLEDTSGVIPDVTGVTFGGVAMTERQNQDSTQWNSIHRFDHQIGSSTASGDIVITADVGCGYIVNAQCAIEVEQQAPEASASSQAKSDTVTTITDDALVMDFCSTGGAGDSNQDASQTLINETLIAGGADTFWAGSSYKLQASAGSVTMQWTGGSATRPMIGLLAYEEASGGGGGGFTPRMMMMGVG